MIIIHTSSRTMLVSIVGLGPNPAWVYLLALAAAVKPNVDRAIGVRSPHDRGHPLSARALVMT
jgi:hypothetical protein